MRLAPIFVFLTASATFACGGGDPSGSDRPGGKADDPVDAEFGLDERPENATCFAPARPPSGSSVTTQRAFPNLTFSTPVAMMQEPNDDQWYVVEKRGVVFTFPDQNNVSASSARAFLDIRSRVNSTPNEAGLLGLAFHPNFPSDPRVFLSYTLTSQGQLFSVVSRMSSADGGETLDPETEEIILFVQQPFENHNGGTIAFGPDGFLYIGYGDGGSANDPFEHGQNTQTRLATMLRIDIDSGADFGIPADNPFADGSGGLPEIYAFGLRNPWKFSFDMETGQLWLADVGQDEFEEINIIENGGNYGWNRKEAFECFADPFPCDDGVIDPVAAYDHSQNDRSITGGYVYRGSAIPSLVGSYVFADFVTGRTWGLFPAAEGGLEQQLLFESGENVAGFAQDHDGEMYLVSFGGTIHRLVSAGNIVDEFPQRLSDTGCFDPDDPTRPAEGMIPYGVNMPLWSDGATKERFMALPPGKNIKLGSDGDFDFPIGTVLTKSFSLAGKLIETRLLVRHSDGGWGGYAYEWNSAGTEAELLQAGKTVEVGNQTWSIPSRADCLSCHTAAAGRSLGPELAQLNGKHVYPSTNRSSNQLATLDHIGVFDKSVDPDDEVAMPTMGSNASDEAKARAYLHSNCAHCHRPGGPGRSDADLRFATDFGDMGVCNTEPIGGTMGVFGAKLVVPGDAGRSLMSKRMQALDVRRMPPIGTAQIHDDGVELIDSWIESLSGCQ